MKAAKYIGTIIIVISLIAWDYSRKNPFDNNAIAFDFEYTVSKIDSVNQFYKVYLERNDSIFKVITEKNNELCNRIEVGGQYEIILESWFKPEEIHLKLRMAGVKIDGTYITIERDSIVGDLFVTENLRGLCYIK